MCHGTRSVAHLYMTKYDTDGENTLALKRRGRRASSVVIESTEKKNSHLVITETSIPTQLQLRKAVEALTIRNVASSGEITFLQRKAFNAMLQIAQRNRLGTEITFEVSIAEFEELVGQSTNNSRSFLKKMLRQLTTIQVEFDFRGDSTSEKSSWGIANLIAEVYISSDGVIKFSFPSEMAKRLLDPAMFHRIDMRMQNSFTSYSALTLYEIVSRYETAPKKETFHEHWTTWSVLLSGASKPHSQFRDFNKMLVRAIEQVNAQQNRFTVTAHAAKRERKVDSLWFSLEMKIQKELDLSGTNSIINEDLKRRALSLALTIDEITAAVLQYNEEYVLAHIDYTERRVKNKRKTRIDSPSKYLKAALEGNYAQVPQGAETGKGVPETCSPTMTTLSNAGQPVPKVKRSTDMLRAAYKAEQLIRIKTEFSSLSKDEKKARLESIENDLRKNDTIWKAYETRGLTKSTETAILQILLEREVGDVSAETLLNWALENDLLTT